MSIKIEHRNLEIRKTRNDFSVQVLNFLLPLSLKFLRHKERDTHSFYSGFFICPPPISCDTCPRPPRTSESQLSSPEACLNSTQLTYSKIPKSSARALPVYDVIHIHWSTFLSGFYFDIHERHILPARALTPALKFAPNWPMCSAERFSA